MVSANFTKIMAFTRAILHPRVRIMKLSLYTSKIHQLIEQRNALVLVAIALGLSNVGLVVLLTFKAERVILVPPQIQRSFWVEGSKVSAAYLEEMALFFSYQLLDVTPSSAACQREIALRYVVADFHNALKKRLITEEERYRKENLSTSFKVCEVVVTPNTRTVKLTGDLVSYVGGQKIKQSREIYSIRFRVSSGRYLIESFEMLESKDA